MTSYTNDWGLPKPGPSDLIAGNSSNLRLDLHALADKTDQVLTQAAAASNSRLESLEDTREVTLRFVRNLSAGEDLNEITAPGVYGISSASVSSQLVNNPLGYGIASRGNLIVTGPNSGNRQQTVLGESGQNVFRSTALGGGWTEWRTNDGIGLPLPENIVLQDYRIPGNHYVGTVAWAGTIQGRPPINAAPAVILQYGHNGGPSTQRFWIDHTGQGIWFQRLFGGWQPWQRIDGASSGEFDVEKGHYGGPNQLRLDAFTQEYPLVSTGDKGAVVIRWDHGLTRFKDTLLPLHEQHQIPGIIAMNSRNWHYAENAGMTKTEAAALAAGGLIEWGNHGADGAPEGQPHTDDPTKDGLWDQIVEGRRELENDLGIPIHIYLRPGTSGTQGGLGNISTIDQLTSTYAGALILGHHAVTSGYFPNSASRLLDGKIKQGQAHWNMEQQPLENIITQIDNAISAKRCLCIMGHPRNLDKPGYYTTAIVEQVFEYISQKIQSGELANISPLQSLHAEL